MSKYLVILKEEKTLDIIDRFYFDTLEELQNWFNKELDTLFNYGFSSKQIEMYRISKGGE